MTTLLNNWIQQLKESNAEASSVSQLLQTQQLLQKNYEEQHSQDQAILLSLHQLGARFSLLEFTQDKSKQKNIYLLLVIQILLSQLPSIVGFPLSESTIAYYVLNMIFFVLFFFALALTRENKTMLLYSLFLGALAVVTNIQLTKYTALPSQTFTLSVIHLVLLSLLSIAFLLPYSTYTQKMNHLIRFLGELFLLTFLVACAAIVMMMLSILLFETLALHIEDRLAQVFATAILPSLPLFCYHLLSSKKASLSLIPKLLASVALPFVIILMASFLLVLTFGNIAIAEDRNLLLILNILLALTLVLILFKADSTKTEEQSNRGTILLLVALSLAIILDSIALVAIGSRFLQYGVSANRIAILAENILLLANVSMLLITLLRKVPHSKLQALFFTLYGLWFLFVVLVFGPMFGYR